jgi:hypothetical protein
LERVSSLYRPRIPKITVNKKNNATIPAPFNPVAVSILTKNKRRDTNASPMYNAAKVERPSLFAIEEIQSIQ